MAGRPEMAGHEAVRVKPAVQWRSQDAVEAGNVHCLLKEAAASSKATPNKRPQRAATSNPVGEAARDLCLRCSQVLGVEL